MTARRKIPFVIVLLLAVMAACGGSDHNASPSVKIIAPRDQFGVTLGETLQIESRTRDDNGIDRVELRAGNSPIDIQQAPEGETSYRAQQSWTPTIAGTHTIAVIAYDKQGQPSEPVTITVNVNSALDSPAASQMVSGAAPAPTTMPSGGPDLDIIDVSGNLDLAVGEPLVLQVTVHNQGPGATDKPALVRLALGDGVVTESYIPPLPAGGQVVATVSLSHAFSEKAEVVVVIAVDPEGKIAEEFEDNNTTQVRLKVDSP